MLDEIGIGVIYGSTWGYVGHLLLFRKMENNRAAGHESLRGIGLVFFLRYIIDAIALVLLYLVMESAGALVAAGISITVAVKVTLFTVYARKGGRFE